MQAINYNIHDILKFKIIREKGYGLRDLINLKFSFFEINEIDKPDITLYIGKFIPSNENCYFIDHKYYVKEDYLYCKDSEGNAKWEVEIIGFEDKNTIINFNGIMSGFQCLINPNFIAQNFLLRLIEYKLNKKGYFLAHSAAVSKNEQAYAFAGRGGTFKTSLCMDFIRRAGFNLLGDDRVIIHEDEILSFPMGLRMFGFMCDHLSNETSWNTLNKIRFAKYLWHTKNKKNTPIKIGKQSKLKSLFIILKTNKQTITKREVPLKEAVNKLIINNQLEDFISLAFLGITSGPFLQYSSAYTFIFPDNQIAIQQKDQKKKLESILENLPIYEITIPYNYDINIVNEIHEIIRSLE